MMYNWEVLRFSRAKQWQKRQIKRPARANLFFLLIRSIDLDAIFIAVSV